jgi:hypothetical protein
MAEVRVVEEIGASADAVWELVRDFGGVMKWASTLESCKVEGEGIGAVRTLALPGGAAIRERLERFEDAARSFSYSILDGPLPVEDYLATLVVRAKGADRCEVDWASTFEPKGVPEERVLGIIRGVYEGGIREIKKNLEK